MKDDKYRKKYQLNKDTDLTNKYLTSITNPTVQPDTKTEMGVPIPDTQNVEYSKEYEEENKL
ncbi:MAG: hypothetical protein SOY48_09605 [Eubacterium sp.]|nr:hypothetical protein [Eubacterium sp.]MDD6568979.1 hypothetical protein [Eubacteriales bacterium]MDY4111116.1 hypothetical protein [Eubacterium sp.]